MESWAAWAAWRESSRSCARLARAAIGSSTKVLVRVVAAMAKNVFQVRVEVVGGTVAATVGHGVVLAAAGLQLLKTGWYSGASGDRVVALAEGLDTPLVRRSTLAGRAGYCSNREPLLRKLQMVEKLMDSKCSDSGMESSLVGSATKWASRRCSRLALVVVVIAFSNMSFAS